MGRPQTASCVPEKRIGQDFHWVYFSWYSTTQSDRKRTLVCLLKFKEILNGSVFCSLVPLFVRMVDERQRSMAVSNVGFRCIDREVQDSAERVVVNSRVMVGICFRNALQELLLLPACIVPQRRPKHSSRRPTTKEV